MAVTTDDLSKKVKHAITGTEGTLTAYCAYAAGSTDRVEVTRLNNEGDIKRDWHDAQDVSLV